MASVDDEQGLGYYYGAFRLRHGPLSIIAFDDPMKGFFNTNNGTIRPRIGSFLLSYELAAEFMRQSRSSRANFHDERRGVDGWAVRSSYPSSPQATGGETLA